MRKYILVLIFLNINVYSQVIENNSVPNVIPPSPTVASFMKFEEIPVSHYTGVPEITIPIHSTKLKNGQNFDVKLQYHIATTNTNAVASDCGLGWSLSAGGTISRIIRGLPDEVKVLDGTKPGKIGIYQTGTVNHINRFYEYSALLENNGINSGNFEMVNEYLWDVSVRGKYDTQHDIYQYNFMGYTGRFYIKKVNNVLQVVKLDKNPLQITNTYNATTYVPDSFTIVDQYGNRYVFNVKENSTYSKDMDSYSYLSAFHLSQVFDANNVLLVSLNYSNTVTNEAINLSTTNYNYDKLNVISTYTSQFEGNGMQGFSPLPMVQTSMGQITTATKKLESIVIEGLSKVYFTFAQGRSDTNLILANTAYRLNEIYVKDWKDTKYRKFSFVHAYSNQLKNRMMLREIKLYNTNETVESNYLFDYKLNPGGSLGADYWGYFNTTNCENQNRETTPGYSDIDVLQKIKYPEGGSTVFDFEPNTYSYESNVAITDFDSNSTNWYIDSQTTHTFVATPTDENDPLNLNYSATETQYLDIYPGLVTADNEYKFLYLYRGESAIQGLSCINECPSCKIRVVLQPGHQYSLRFSNVDLERLEETLTVNIDYIKRKAQPDQFLCGRGNRIQKIGYFDKNVHQNYYQEYPNYVSEGLPEKEINYNYQYFNNPLQSSGALVFPKPKYTYERSKRECVYTGSPYNSGMEFDIIYNTFTTINNLAAIKTKGADVGYKNVSVSQTGNGYRRLTYTNSLDYPEVLEYENLNPPFLPTANIDYKRGLLLEEQYFNNSGLALKKTVNAYSFEDALENTGIIVFNPNAYQFINVRSHIFYSSYKNYLDTHTTSCFCCFDEPISFTNSIFHHEALGWSKLDSSTQYEYFYDSNNALIDTVQKQSLFTYNNFNYRVATKKVTDAYNGFIETRYFYPTDAGMSAKPLRNELVSRNMIGLALVTEKYRGSEKVFEKETEYGSYTSATPGFSLILPKYLYSKKGSSPMVKDVSFDSYDLKGNLTQYTPNEGVPTSIIWGYNSMFPVVRIENFPYASITPSLITAIQTPSNSPTGTQSQVLSAIDNLRNNALFANGCLINSFTYDPLKGMTSVKDTKGDILTYSYDLFNRLQLIKDKDGNFLKEYEYHFRP